MVSLDWLETVTECTNGVKIGGLKSWTPTFMGILDELSTHSSSGCAPSLLCCGNWGWSGWGMKADHSHPSSAEVTDQWSCTLLHTFFYGMYRGNFTFMLHYWFFCYVVPCECAVLSTINTEHIRWYTIHSLHFSESYIAKTRLTLCVFLTCLPLFVDDEKVNYSCCIFT
jgi:hypothetical protein